MVVKLPIEERVDDARVSRRLAHEAWMLRRLAHPGIRRLLADGHGDPVPHLVLEHVPGPTLQGLLDEHGPLEPDEVARAGVQLAACLHYLHDWGLVHLGLEPCGLAFCDGRVVALDLDRAARAGGWPVPRPSCRSRAYQAPERCLGAPASPLMDLFALGAVLYELATGGPAFCAEDAFPGCEFPQLVIAPARAGTLAELPVALEAVIHDLLQPDAGRRPRTALQTLHRLAMALPEDEDADLPGPTGIRPWRP